MIDIHTHVLPGIDDGAASLEQSVAICRAAAEDGTTALIATPHQRIDPWWNDDVEHLARLRDQLAAALAERAAAGETVPEVHLGAEIRVGAGLLDDLDRMPDAPVQPLAGGHWLLLELSRSTPWPDPESLVHELVVAGWRPILAHPEDLSWLADDLPRLAGLVDRGATLQVTAGSVTGDRGRPWTDRARRLLDAGLVAFVASDSHNVTVRPPGLARAAATIERLWGAEAARLLTHDHPAAVLADRPLPGPAAEETGATTIPVPGPRAETSQSRHR